jgi:hypothetical protein
MLRDRSNMKHQHRRGLVLRHTGCNKFVKTDGADGNAKPRIWELNIGTPDYLGSVQATGDEPTESEMA